MQSLAQKKILQYCDYLSTVSGGGYIGSCLSSLLTADANASTQAKAFPLCAQRESELEERKEVNHLRKTKNFLGFNQGLFSPDLWCFIGSFLSGLILMNVFPLFALLLMVAVLYLFSSPPITLVANVIILSFIAILFILIVLTRFRQAALFLNSSDEHIRFKQNKRIADRTAWLSFLVLILLLINVIYTWASNWASVLNSLSFYLVLPVPIIVIAYLIPRKNKFQQKLSNMIMAVALIGLFLLSSALILSYLYQQERAKITADIVDELPSELEEPLNDIIERSGIFSGSEQILATVEKIRTEYALKHTPAAEEKIINAFHELMNALNYERQRLSEQTEIDEQLKISIEKLATPEAEQGSTLWLQPQKVTFIAKPLADYLNDIEQLTTRLYQENLYSLATRWAIMKQEFIFIFLILLLFIFFNININYCSQHYFYREGLSRTFLIKRRKDASQPETNAHIEPNSKLLLTELHEHHNGPYHLLNATLNVPHSQNSILQGRGADFFIFSKYYCGS